MTNWRDIIRSEMEARGLNPKSLARIAGTGDTGVRDMLNLKIVRSPRLETIQKVAHALNIPFVDLFQDGMRRLVPVIGYASAGEGWTPFKDQEALDEIEIDPGVGQAVAVVVRGDSMAPVYRDGDTLIGAKTTSPTKSLVGFDCIVETMAGDRFIKFLAAGPERGRFNLKSYNPAHADHTNVLLRWAAPITMVMRGANRFTGAARSKVVPMPKQRAKS